MILKNVMLAKFPAKRLPEIVAGVLPLAAGHLDLEGVCYLKIVRTGPNEAFAQDATSYVLKKDMTQKEISKTYWDRPAMEKWGSPCEGTTSVEFVKGRKVVRVFNGKKWRTMKGAKK